ncbi:MAG: phosphatase PAP2 family protein [Desulfobacterales bacterium]|nr:phosphatase PAP2 family protein [Desulfobacterales bacterium]
MPWILQLDYTIFHWINTGWTNPFFNLAMPWITRLGDSAVVLPWIIGAGALAGRQFAGSERSHGPGRRKLIFKAGYFFAIYAFLIYGVAGGLACGGLKKWVSRPRPFVSQKVVLRTSSIVTTGPHRNRSFPSGHACNAFMIAAIFADRLRGRRWLFFGAASLVALSRVYLGVHFPSDVIAGALLGWGAARLMLSYRPSWEKASDLK